MKNRLFKYGIPLVVVIALGFLITAWKSMQPTFSNFTLTMPSGDTMPVSFPGFMQSTQGGIYRLAGTLTVDGKSSKVLRIIPDDEILELRVNQVPVSLDAIPQEQRRDYNKGFTYDLSTYLNEGDNQIEIIYSDRGGLMGVVINAEVDETIITILLISAVIIAVFLSLLLLESFHLSPSFKIIFIGALLVRIMYFSVTPADVRDHDLGDHIGYTEYLTKHWMPPPIDYAVGGAFFHPPLYYYAGAIVYKATQLVEPHNKFIINRVQQLISLACSMGFVLFGLLILQKLLALYKVQTPELIPDDGETSRPRSLYSSWCESYRKNGLFWIIGALFAFWPSAVVHSVRIGNDPMLYFLVSASLFYIIRWYRSDANRDLLVASVWAAAAVLTKANGEILIAVLGVIGIYKMLKTGDWARYFKAAIIPGTIVVIALAITVGPALVLKMQGKRDNLYVDNLDGISTANLVGNTAANYLWFDAKIFITEPYADPYDDRMGRQFFWNYLGKTGIVGEFKYPKLISINTTTVCSFLAIVMFIYTVVGLYHMRKSDFKVMAPILLFGFFFWAGVTYMRMTFPANIDFRYILPILITVCALYAVSIITFERRGAWRLATIGKIIAILFTISGIVFSVTV